MKGICALYDKECKLLDGHIYPKFIVKHTKKKGCNSQQDLIEKEILENPERFWNSDLGQSLINDIDFES